MNRERLEKLATHLESGRLGHKRFDFGAWHQGEPTLTHCGTLGCALGEMPVIEPEYWYFSDWMGEPLCGGCGLIDGPVDCAKEWFGLSGDEACFLFLPFSRLNGERGPPSTATRKEVAAHIHRFVARRVQGEAF